MATRSTAARAPRPAPARPAPRRARLAVLSAKDLRHRTQVRRARLLVAFAAALVVGSLLLVAAAQAIVASQQLHIDGVQQQLSDAVTTNGNLELQRAQLDSPARILKLAQHQLGMVTPRTVVYLVPVSVGPTVAASARPGRP